MQHLYNLTDANLWRPSVVTIGVFDGVHRGHQHLIRRLVEEAHRSERLAVVLTFYPHPDVVLRGLSGRYYLTTPDQKAELLGNLGVDLVVTLRFDDAFRQIRAADFVNMMVERLSLSSLWVGADFALGYKREGNIDFLRQHGETRDFAVQVIDMVEAPDMVISSTAIRETLLGGEVERARDWLGRAYSVTGEVVHGQKRGRTIGYPTANMAVWDEQVIPANGIYAGWAHLGDDRFMAMTNVGVSPTFGNKAVTVEPYLLDFDRDIYGEQLTLTFEKRLRPEARFESIEALIRQIDDDVRVGREYLAAQVR